MPRPKIKSKDSGLQHRYAVKMLGEIPDTILPEGWIGVYHVCGALVYLHRETRVVTWSRPYVISKETSLKKHDVPLMSIPCLHQKLALGETIPTNSELKRGCTHDEEPASKSRKVDIQSIDEDVVVNENNIKQHDDVDGTNNETEETEQFDAWNGDGVDHSDQINESKCNAIQNVNETCEIPCEIPCNGLSEETNVADEVLCNGLSEEKDVGDSMEIGDDTILSIDDNKESSETSSDVISCSNNATDLQGIEDVDPSINISSDNNSENENEDKPDNPNMVNPIKFHNYLSKIFELDILPQDQGRTPVLSYSSPLEAEVIEENVEKKFITDGKTHFQILNEYCQKELKSLPTCNKIERISQHDFTVEIVIKNFKFGISAGDTLRQAKHSAASCTLAILNSSLLIDEDEAEETSDYLKIFDKLPCDDPVVLPTIEEFSALESVKYPYEILLHLLTRNFADFEETEVTFGLVEIGGVKEYVMQYKEYVASGGTGEESAKQLAAQAFIQLLYPDLKTWGSVIRLMEAHTKLVLSRNANTNSDLSKPSKCIIHVLRQEMRKIAGN